MEEKIVLIDLICKQHPSFGTVKGWSEYTGGMKDSGQWFFRKMLDVPFEELKLFYYELTHKEKTSSDASKQSFQEFYNELEYKTFDKLFGNGPAPQTKYSLDQIEECLSNAIHELRGNINRAHYDDVIIYMPQAVINVWAYERGFKYATKEMAEQSVKTFQGCEVREGYEYMIVVTVKDNLSKGVGKVMIKLS